MLIPQEYKQTEFGVVPKDQDITTIGKACYINPNNGEIPNKFLYIDLESVNRGFLEKKKYINKKEAPSRAQRLVKKKDVLFQLVRPYQQNNYFNTKYTVAVASTGYAVLREHLINIDLIYQIIHTKNFTKQVLDKCTGTSYPAITSTNFENVKFCYPKNYLEQKCIATVLNDTDKLINNLNKLIKKKIAIKQGVMQELLTGKRRLPGFSGKWVKKRLGDIGFTYTGLSGKNKNDFQQGNAMYIPFLNILNNPIIDVNDFEIVNINDNEKQNKVLKGDLLFNNSSENPEEVGICSLLDNTVDNLYLNSFCFGYRLKDENISGLYLSYYFRSNLGRMLMIKLAQGITRYNLSKSKFLSSTILLANTFEEQKAIASILFDMDKEIKSLENKKIKYEKIKQGMMQELLTGRIRLLD